MTLRLLLLAALLAATPTGAGAQATRPIARPDRLLADLGSADPRDRAAARVGLTQLPAADLPALRDAVDRATRGGTRPLPPGQSAVLGDAVRLVRTAATLEAASADLRRAAGPDAGNLPNGPVAPGGNVIIVPLRPGAGPVVPGQPGVRFERVEYGFLGVRLALGRGPGVPRQQDGRPAARGEADPGAVVKDVLPGFAAYGEVLDGDLVLGLRLPGARDAVAFGDAQDLIDTVSRLAPGTRLTLLIARDQRVEPVPVTLGTRPDDLDRAGGGSDVVRRADDDAAAYWQAEFAPLLGGGSAASGDASGPS